jgi:hypothetical protein
MRAGAHQAISPPQFETSYDRRPVTHGDENRRLQVADSITTPLYFRKNPNWTRVFIGMRIGRGREVSETQPIDRPEASLTHSFLPITA